MKPTEGASLRFAFLAVLFFSCVLPSSYSKAMAEPKKFQPAPKPDSLAAATLQSLEASPYYVELSRLYEERLREEGDAWANTVQGQRVGSALERLRTEAKTVTTVDPENPEGQHVLNYTTIDGRIFRFTGVVADDVESDPSTRANTGAVLARIIAENAAFYGLFLYDVASPEREAFEKGITAAKEGDYYEALIFFEEARLKAPHAVDLYYNMGLAESMMPGRELRAISWFGAYLAANPGAINTVAIRARMAALETKSEKTIRTFMQLSEEIAKEFTIAYYYDNCLFRSAVQWARIGDVAALERIEGLIADPPQKSFTLHELVKVHLRNGDVAAAEKVQAKIERAETKDEAQLDIADAQFNRGDYEGARQTLTAALENTSSTIDDFFKSTVLTRMAKVQIKQGDIASAKETLEEAKKRIAAFDRYSTIKAQCFIAEAEVLAGDIEAAEKTFMAANDYAAALGTETALYHIAEARARTGDIDEAIRISDSVAHPSDAGRDLVNMGIIEVQLKAGDVEGAQRTADKIAGYYNKKALLLIKEAKMKRESDPWYWLANLNDPDFLNDKMFLDLKGEMRNLSLVEDPVNSFEGVLGRAEIYLEAHQAVQRMIESLASQEARA